MTGLCLVRHGQTDWNQEGRYQGQSDVPLNEAGRAQARRLAKELKEYPFVAVYSSDLMRARETAGIIAATLNRPVTLETRLREINQGGWEGELVENIMAGYGEAWKQRKVDPASFRPPGGETVAEVARRVYAALDHIARLHPGATVLIVSHGLVMATAICKVHATPLGQAFSVIPNNADPVWLDWKVK